jgi:hypothetical protein
MKKILVVGIILLFIGVTVTPTINYTTVKASYDDLVEVTTQACGIQGFGNTTVRLTREQYQNLEQYLVEFRAKLNQTTTREEAIPIFKEAAVELNKYGLLPKGISVERAQQLVTGQYQNKNILKLQERLLNTSILGNNNYFCLIAGVTSYVVSFGFPFRSLIYFDIAIEKLTALRPLPMLVHFLDLLDIIIMNLFSSVMGIGALLFLGVYNLIPLKTFSCVSFGMGGDSLHPENPSDGWIVSFGLGGVKFLYRPFTGNISTIEVFVPFVIAEEYFFGATGFTGIAIRNIDSDNTFLIGTALHAAFNQLEWNENV